LIAWPDFTTGIYPNLYGHLVTQTGNLSGSMLTLATDQYGDLDPGIAFNPLSGEYLLVWTRNRPWDIKARRLSTTGARLGSEITICGDGAKQQLPAIALNPNTGGYLVAWEDDRNGNADVYAYVNPGTSAPGPTFTATCTPTPTRTSVGPQPFKAYLPLLIKG